MTSAPGALVAGYHLTALEIGYSARSHADYIAKIAGQKALVWLPVTEEAMDRALEVQGLLAARGAHRLPIPDLILSATAEVHGATVLHVDMRLPDHCGDHRSAASATRDKLIRQLVRYHRSGKDR
ncbi:hypothetical protein IU486_04835 [Streptomyces gardneri]|nr:hypothetical protein [Streptomyces gardneri]